MRTVSRPWVIGVAATALAAAALLGAMGWPQPNRTFELAGLTLAAMLSAVFVRRASTSEWTIVPLSFIVDFAALLLLGPHAAALIALVAMVMQGLVESHRAHLLRRTAVN